MRRGRALAPDRQRFLAVGDGPGIYLAEIGLLVKVGMSHTLGKRLKSLHIEQQRKGEGIGRFGVFAHPRFGLWNAEFRCIQALATVATIVPGRREYFTGISFDDACEMLDELMSSAAAPESTRSA